jgi:hypothetical protein
LAGRPLTAGTAQRTRQDDDQVRTELAVDGVTQRGRDGTQQVLRRLRW